MSNNIKLRVFHVSFFCGLMVIINYRHLLDRRIESFKSLFPILFCLRIF